MKSQIEFYSSGSGAEPFPAGGLGRGQENIFGDDILE